MAQCGFTAGTTSIKKACLVCSSGVPSRFTRTNLFKQGKISEVAKWLNCSVVSRIARDSGSSPGRATIFSFSVTFSGQWHMSSNHSELIYVHCCWYAMLRAMKLLPVMIIVLIIFSGPLE